MKERWITPEIQIVSNEKLNQIVNNILTIESSLYASGCHRGMQPVRDR